MSLHHATKNKDFNLFGFSHAFRCLILLKLMNFDQKLKISNSTNFLAQHLSWQCLINISLYHATKNKDFNFFGFSHSFPGLTPLKLENFDQKLIISNNPKKFAHSSSWEYLINTSIIITWNFKILNFIFDLSLFFVG